MMAKIEDVFQIIRDRNIKNGMENHYSEKISDQRTFDIKKKGRGDIKEKIQKVDKKYDRRSRSRSQKRRSDDRSQRDRMHRDGNRYAKDDKYNNRYTRGEKKDDHSKDKKHVDKKKKDYPRSNSSSSDHKSKNKIKNGSTFSLSPEVKD